MKNILLLTNYNIDGKRYASAHSRDYVEFVKLCEKSFRKNLEDLDEIVILTGEKSSYDDVFKEVFYKTDKLFHGEPCNLLYTDSDTLCIQPTKIFNEYPDFRGFWICNEKEGHYKYSATVPSELHEHLRPFFQFSMRYFPHGTKEKIWKVGRKLARNWINIWGYEGILYNSMFFSQYTQFQRKKIDFSAYHQPHLNFQCPKGANIPDDLSKIHIIHFHGSRGSGEVLRIMGELLEKINKKKAA